jgi:cell division protein FtsW
MVNSAGMTVLAEGVSPRALLLSRATIYMALAVAAMFAASRLPLRRLAGYFGEPDPALARPGAPLFSGLSFLISPAVLFVVLLALVYAPVIGKEVNGANRWIRLPVPGLGDALSVQPSEIVKWGMIGAIAWYCCRRAPVLSAVLARAVPGAGVHGRDGGLHRGGGPGHGGAGGGRLVRHSAGGGGAVLALHDVCAAGPGGAGACDLQESVPRAARAGVP